MTKFSKIFKHTLFFGFVGVTVLISCGKKGGSSNNTPAQSKTFGPLIATVNNVSVAVNGCSANEIVCCRLDYTTSTTIAHIILGQSCSSSFTANFTPEIQCSGVWSGSVTCKNTFVGDQSCEGLGGFTPIAPTSVSGAPCPN